VRLRLPQVSSFSTGADPQLIPGDASIHMIGRQKLKVGLALLLYCCCTVNAIAAVVLNLRLHEPAWASSLARSQPATMVFFGLW
jgi:hypothetical protein